MCEAPCGTGAPMVAAAESVPILTPVRASVPATADRKSTRLNSSHLVISYAVFCLKKKQQKLRFDRLLTVLPSAQSCVLQRILSLLRNPIQSHGVTLPATLRRPNRQRYLGAMPELPELEALRIRMGPRLEGRLITAAEVNQKKAHMLRYPVDDFARELPARRILSLTRRGKHLAFATELGGGGSPRWLVINPMLGGRFQLVDGEAPVPATPVFTTRVEGRLEM